MQKANIFEQLPDNPGGEIFDILLQKSELRVERIVSRGDTTAAGEWYDQEQDEWVIVLRGAAVISFDDGAEFDLGEGDYLNIPARVRHRVAWTNPEQETIWLAIFYRGDR